MSRNRLASGNPQSAIRNPQSHAGFTLVELLIVIGIIAFLAAILVVAVKGVIGNARAAATKGTVRKVDSLLTKRMEAFNRALKDQDALRAAPNVPQYAVPYLQAAGNSRDLARVLGSKALFRRHFPQRFGEMDSPPAYNSAKHRSETESAACLYYMLTNMPAFGAEAPDSDLFGSNEAADTDGDGLLEFVDGWGKPLRFYRWPTRLVRPEVTAGSEGNLQTVDTKAATDPHDSWTYGRPIRPVYSSSVGAGLAALIGGQPTAAVGLTFGDEHTDRLAKDPDDPLGLLHPTDRSKASSQASNFEQDYHTGDTYHTPLIVSGGQDGQLGLYEPNNTAQMGRLAQPDLSNLAALLDNITNRNVRAGGN